MQTVKLYDENAYLREFETTVVSCEKQDNAFALILKETAFFPEEGGQPCDTGNINGETVLHVFEKSGVITHTVNKPFSPGEKVKGIIDFDRRFDFMQNHTGEHIVSGIAYKKYGFNNVGFHLNENFATVDFDGVLTREMLNEIEDAANKAVFENAQVTCYYPDKETLKNLFYRSKKEIEGPLRIVEISGVDVCACCAPHVDKTGEVGIIKLLDAVKMRGGTRVVLKCGRYALSDYRNKFSNVSAISDMLSSKQETAAQSVKKLIEKQDEIKQKNNELIKQIIQNTVLVSSDKHFIYEKDYDRKQIEMLADGLHKAYGGIRAAFSGKNGELAFAVCGDEEELKEFFDLFKSRFSVRGGGRGEMVEGGIFADVKEVEKFFKERFT